MGTAAAAIGHNRERKTTGDLVLPLEIGTVATECRTLMTVRSSLSNLEGSVWIWISTVQSVIVQEHNTHKNVFTSPIRFVSWSGNNEE